MFLIRTAFWLCLLILLLPTDEQEQRVVYGNVETAVKDLSTFCTRNPGVCEASRDAAHVFSQKAQFGAKMLMDFFQDGNGNETYMPASAEQGSRMPSFFRKDAQNTLTDDDRRLAWSVPTDGV